MTIVSEKFPDINPGRSIDGWTISGEPFSVRENGQRRYLVVAECGCGKIKTVQVRHLRDRVSRNCGCTRMAAMKASATTHGGTRTKLYRQWKGMHERCEYAKHKAYLNYGGRGISVCDEWHSYPAFLAWAKLTGYQHGLQIDRIDVNGDYMPDNCRWVTCKVNSNNKRRHRMLTAWGETKNAYDWSLDGRCKVSDFLLRARVKQGWSDEDAIATPQLVYPAAPVTAFGETKTVVEWSVDQRCVVKENCLRMRLDKYGWHPERAITTPARGYRYAENCA